MKVAVVGATGLVGSKMLEILEERAFPLTELLPVASEKSVGKKIKYNSKEYSVISLKDAVAAKPDLAIFSAGGATSMEWAPQFADIGCKVIDNSSAWRMNPRVKLVVPEVNAHVLTDRDMIIANPNCSTIQMVVALNPLHQKYGINRIVVSTYQSVTGSGHAGINQLMDERNFGSDQSDKVRSNYPHQIDLNLIPHIDVFLANGYTKEEEKMINETHKIFDTHAIKVTATCVRVPVKGGHSESINVTLKTPFEVEDIAPFLAEHKGITIIDNIEKEEYPMPLNAWGKDDVFVGRIRRDNSAENSINLWVVSDNLRKGAATNAVQIAEVLNQKKFI